MRSPSNHDADDPDNPSKAKPEPSGSDIDQKQSQQLKTYIGKVIGGIDAARRFQELIAQTLRLKKNH
jgi:hypothetical protein